MIWSVYVFVFFCESIHMIPFLILAFFPFYQQLRMPAWAVVLICVVSQFMQSAFYLYQGRFLETAVSVYFCFRLHYFCTRHCLFPGSVLHQRSELGFLFSAHDAADYGHFYRHAAICASFPDEDEGPCFRGR